VEDLFFLFLARGEEEDSEATKKKKDPQKCVKTANIRNLWEIGMGNFSVEKSEKKNK
jgi:hypothetical protein